MANEAFLPFPISADIALPRARSLPRQAEVALATVDLHQTVMVVALLLDEETSVWLRAVGISEGESLVPLRRAIFGGPIHVRTGSGGEFALHRELARAILVRGEAGTT